jgi:hypothetical protein
VSKSINLYLAALLVCCFGVSTARAQPPAPADKKDAGAQTAAPAQTPALDAWGDTFDGNQLDASKWEPFSFQGVSGGRVKVEGGELRMRGMHESRAGVRSKRSFTSDRFIVEGTVRKVSPSLPAPGEQGLPLGSAVLNIMFDGSGRNRIEWLLTSEGTFQAWSVVDGVGERLDNRNLATKIKNPTLAVVRRGDEFLFIINAPGQPAEAAQVAVTKSIRDMPRSFRVMLYGFSSSENNWDSVRVVTTK